jgi:hypothetical protein
MRLLTVLLSRGLGCNLQLWGAYLQFRDEGLSGKRALSVMVKEACSSKATTRLGLCQVRSETERPCLRLAVVTIGGIPFCEPCAREQEAYFKIGELTQPLATDRTNSIRDFSGGETRVRSLLKALGRMRRELTERNGEAERAKSAVGSPE